MDSRKRKSTFRDSFFIKKENVDTQMASISDSVELDVSYKTTANKTQV